MASFWTQQTFVDALTAAVNLSTDTLKVMALKSIYVADPDHKFVSSLAASECDATGYAGGFGGAGRKTLSGKTVTIDDINNRALFDANDPATWTSLGGTVDNTLRYVAVIKEITSDAASRVICILDFGANKSTNGGDFTVTFPTSPSAIAYINC